MPTFYQKRQELAEALIDKLNDMLENDFDIEVNSVHELEDKIKELTNPYHGWKYAKRKYAKKGKHK